MASLWNSNLPCYIAGGVITTAATFIVIRRIMHKRAAAKLAARKAAYPADTVILNQFERGPYAPSLSPFPIKLETFLRMADIPYKTQFDMPMSTKNKTPWMTYNGEDVADSQFCIDYLKERLGKDVNAHLTTEQRAIARAFQKMADEHFYWTVVLQRWIYNIDNYKFVKAAFNNKIPRFFLKQVSKRLKVQVEGQGLGRHSREDVMKLARGDLMALSDYLGDKHFLMGEKPSEVDCAVFGQLCQLKWHLPGTQLETMLKDFDNLEMYCERMKDHFWPDWNECTTCGGTKEAIK